jgi:hypothetical protein
MEHRILGRTGVSVSKLCLGAMMFGDWGTKDHDESIRIIHWALDAGINFIDTADVYSGGESEIIVGEAGITLIQRAARRAHPFRIFRVRPSAHMTERLVGGPPAPGAAVADGQLDTRHEAACNQAASVPGSVNASRWSPKSAMISRRPPRAST